MDGMIHIAFAFNFNIQRSVIEVGEERPIIDRGYKPLLRLLLAHGVKADLFLSGFSTMTLRRMEPGVLATIQDNLGQSFELGSYTYPHPIPQLLLPQEMARQIRRGLQIDREAFGIDPQGFLPSEMAYSYDMVKVLEREGLKWVVVLSSLLEKAAAQRAGGQAAGGRRGEIHTSCTAVSREVRMTVVPAVYQLPELPARFFKVMMKGQLPVGEVIEGVRRFADEHPGALLLFKRDAETIFIDAYNSGFGGTEAVFQEFLSGLAALSEARFITIGEYLRDHPPQREAVLEDFLGNTKIETFTEGDAQPLWDLTRRVREKILNAEQTHPGSPEVEQAWEHLLLSHNSDGRIGYWHSQWNPGEHKVAASRRAFVNSNLEQALKILDRLS
jgi:peptidoglycan/xylan/chitin deacetylase (PgdA/CDA1 family)